VGPTWKGLAGSTVVSADGTSHTVDDDYLKEAILNPNAKVREGYPPSVMPQNFSELISEQQLAEIIAFIKSIK
jgi:cytochrome c oxidase subunit 2